jgi:hypothetical protein
MIDVPIWAGFCAATVAYFLIAPVYWRITRGDWPWDHEW